VESIPGLKHILRIGMLIRNYIYIYIKLTILDIVQVILIDHRHKRIDSINLLVVET
jgi:hypothetical protein